LIGLSDINHFIDNINFDYVTYQFIA